MKKEITRVKAVAVALEGSIDKWEKIVDYLKKPAIDWAKLFMLELGGENCPLCLLFPNQCYLCPVYRKVKVPGCRRTPYFDYLVAEHNKDLKEARKWANLELKFLKSLRD